MPSCSAPGKVILFWEHAVVFGEPALAVAINLRTKVSVAPNKDWAVNRGRLEDARQKYVRAAIDIVREKGPLRICIDSAIPEGSGMGSSAAVTVATLGALHQLHG